MSRKCGNNVDRFRTVWDEITFASPKFEVFSSRRKSSLPFNFSRVSNWRLGQKPSTVIVV